MYINMFSETEYIDNYFKKNKLNRFELSLKNQYEYKGYLTLRQLNKILPLDLQNEDIEDIIADQLYEDFIYQQRMKC
jgi:hypothetical protein